MPSIDVVTVSFLVLALVGGIAAALHLIGWVPPRYRRMLGELQDEFASQVGAQVSNALVAPLARLEALLAGPGEDGLSELPDAIGTRLHAELEAAARALESGIHALPGAIGAEVEGAIERVATKQRAELAADASSALRSAEMSIVRSAGVDKQARGQVDRLLGDAILGPALPILQQFAPGLAAALQENPQLIGVIVEHPLFIKYVAPRIAQVLGQPASVGSTSSLGWGR